MPIRPWSGRAAREALARVKAIGRRNNTPCIICDGSIDYDLRWPDVMSCTVQHIKSRDTHPELTWDRANQAPCHLHCNSAVGNGIDRANPYDLGITSI